LWRRKWSVRAGTALRGWGVGRTSWPENGRAGGRVVGRGRDSGEAEQGRRGPPGRRCVAPGPKERHGSDRRSGRGSGALAAVRKVAGKKLAVVSHARARSSPRRQEASDPTAPGAVSEASFPISLPERPRDAPRVSGWSSLCLGPPCWTGRTRPGHARRDGRRGHPCGSQGGFGPDRATPQESG